MITWLIDHLAQHKAAYIIPTLVAGAMVTLGGTAWVDQRINIRVVALEKRFDGIEATLLEAEIRELTKLLCQSPGEAALLRQVDSAERRYKRLTGETYRAPSCRLLGVPGDV
jgi:hypothetical protein